MYSDRELIEKCLAHEPKAQEALYKRFASRMYGVCLRFSRNTLEADDLLQEGFIKVFNYLKDYRFEGSLEGWVRRTIVNTAINYHKHKAKELSEVSIEKMDSEAPVAEEAIDRMSADELLLLIQQLPEGYRVVFNLYVIEGYSHQEIGELLGISENTSKSQLSRARMSLQHKIIQHKSRK
jgi:RNA polymerase sigma-70 factor (ECF subfamily)